MERGSSAEWWTLKPEFYELILKSFKSRSIFAISMKALRVLLFPLAVLFDIITGIRNRLYDQGLKPSASFDVPVISVGNLAVGGTGKTPMVEHLIRILHAQYAVATLSREYGRRTRGIRIAKERNACQEQLLGMKLTSSRRK